MSQLIWQVKTFQQLTNDELYDILKLRIDVFVVEQTCYYPDLDNLDRIPSTLHLFSYQNGKISAYLRILAKDVCYPGYIAIGRVIIAPDVRGKGYGNQLIEQALITCQQYFPQQNIKISAQEHLEQYYQSHGFIRCSEMYLEDGIAHIGMKLVHSS
ncbi:GNAT family N-acetyltransferase [Thalassotalea profundi]|uniref:ElaA protein n=1 Tax=Thalassotalea profundi TaxID=2036687 RepID=A0ABQ3IEQ4_9GAMM|nr:GNAT family N-acetyltransferase [Thalassotalea profundi]GHE78202.1 ElaA protein [Thalassotalea profundi]